MTVPDDVKLIERARGRDPYSYADPYTRLGKWIELAGRLADAVERLTAERDEARDERDREHEFARKLMFEHADEGYPGIAHDFNECKRELEQARLAARAEAERADVMQHERDFEQEVVSADLYNRLEAAEAERDLLAAAMIKARRDLWWFIERDTGDGWGFTESDVNQISERAMAIQDDVLATALASVAGEEMLNEPGSSAAVADTDATPHDGDGPETVGERQGRQPGSLSADTAGEETA